MAAYTRPPPLTLNDRWARARQSKEWLLEAGGKAESEPPEPRDGLE
jgi:hypothetical protein